MRVDLHSAWPNEPIRSRLTHLVTNAVHVDLAVAFVTEAGANAIRMIANQLGDRAKIRLLVSVLFPTRLKAIEELAKTIEVGIHLGHPRRPSENIFRQFHSKVVLIERRDQSRTIIVGSHNWTTNGLDGGNLEASLVLHCDEGDSVVHQTRQHIKQCWMSRRCEPFDPGRMDHYERLQQLLHHNLSQKSPSEKFLGFEAFAEKTIVILAEASGRQPFESGDLYLTVPRTLRRQFTADAPVWIIVFPPRKLFGKGRPFPNPDLYVGQIGGFEVRPGQTLRRATRSFLIRDIEQPVIEAMTEVPPRSRNQIQVAIPFTREEPMGPIPLFHADREPHVNQELDIDGKYEDGSVLDEAYEECQHNAKWPSGLTEDERAQTVPTGLIAQANLRVPFSFMYPPLEPSLEEFGDCQSFFGGGTPCRVKVTRPRGMSEYMCFVQYRSNVALTRHVHASGIHSTP